MLLAVVSAVADDLAGVVDAVRGQKDGENRAGAMREIPPSA